LYSIIRSNQACGLLGRHLCHPPFTVRASIVAVSPRAPSSRS
jgi:hypothetical protein